jgi:hypothetical protein
MMECMGNFIKSLMILKLQWPGYGVGCNEEVRTGIDID